MRLFASLLLILSVSLFAQEKGGKKGPPKKLKLLDPNSNIRETMQAFEKALGVTQCAYCHVQGDFASDGNPKKETARMMISIRRLTAASGSLASLRRRSAWPSMRSNSAGVWSISHPT